MAAKKKSLNELDAVYENYMKACDSVNQAIEDSRTEECIKNDCKENDLPDIDRILIIGKDSNEVYWVFGESAFYWSSSLKQPIHYKDNKLYINPLIDDIYALIQTNLINQYIVISDI